MEKVLQNLLLLGSIFVVSEIKAQLLLEALDGVEDETCLELVQDLYFGDGKHDFKYCAVRMPDGRIWLNNNLGANYSNVHHPSYNPRQTAQGSWDPNAVGSVFQYGRLADGHELVSSYESPNRLEYVYPNITTEYDKNLYYENCPSGYRMPTKEEWKQLYHSLQSKREVNISYSFVNYGGNWFDAWGWWAYSSDWNRRFDNHILIGFNPSFEGFRIGLCPDNNPNCNWWEARSNIRCIKNL